MNRFIPLACLLALCYGATVPERTRALRKAVTSHHGKVVGGTETTIEQAPWLAQVEVDNILLCQAVIINEKWAVTATTCTKNYILEDILLRSGSAEVEEGSVHHVVNITKYHDDTLGSVLALLEVQEPFVWSPSTQAVKLADSEPAPGDTVTIAGWGAYDKTGLVYPMSLFSVDVLVVDRALCEVIYSPFRQITDKIICASDVEKSACDGDEGASVIDKNGKLVGVVYRNFICGREEYPGININMADQEILTFINENTKINK